MQNKYFRKDKYYILMCKSKNQTIQFYSILERKGYKLFQLASAPCKLKGGCNYCIKFNDMSTVEILEAEAKRYKINIETVYLIERKNGKMDIKSIKNFT